MSPGDDPYRIAVGRRDRVDPRQIMGALANEGVCSAGTSVASTSDPITRWWNSPADLTQETKERLKRTRIAGIPIRPPRPTTGPRTTAAGVR